MGRIKEGITERGQKPVEVEVLKDLQDIVGHSEKAIASILNNSFNERAKDSLLKYYIKQNEKFNTEYWVEGVEFIDSIRFNETSKLYVKNTSDSINQELMITEIISTSTRFTHFAKMSILSACCWGCCRQMSFEFQEDSISENDYLFTLLIAPNDHNDYLPNSFEYTNFTSRDSIRGIEAVSIGNGALVKFHANTKTKKWIEGEIVNRYSSDSTIQKNHFNYCGFRGYVGE